MDCPRCNSSLEKKQVGQVEIDECKDCKGIWLEQGELEKLKDQEDPDLNWMDFDLWKHPELFRLETKPSDCPECKSKMVAVDYHESGITIDYCPNCRGTWLDRGQFGPLIDALEKELATKRVPEYIKVSLEEAREIVTGPEGLVHEWKDFSTVLRMLYYRFFVEHPDLQKAALEMQKRSPLS